MTNRKRSLIELIGNKTPKEMQEILIWRQVKCTEQNRDFFGHCRTLYLEEKIIGYAFPKINYRKKKIEGFNFYPFDKLSKLRSRGLGQIAFGNLLIEMVDSMHVGPEFYIDIPLKVLSEEFKKMLSRLGLYDRKLEPQNKIGNYISPFAPFFFHTLERLSQRGCDVKMWVRENPIKLLE